MNSVIFLKNDEALPSYTSSYEGWFVLRESKLYLGTTGGWKELTDSKIGELVDLTTTDKSSIVAAINELKGEIGDINTILEDVLYTK